MKRITILWVLLWFVVACGPSGGAEGTAVSPNPTQASAPSEEIAVEQEEAAVSEPEPSEETALSEPESGEETAVAEVEATEPSSVPAGEPVAALAPATTAAEAAVVREQDWTRGSDNPDIIIIEYGDFQ